MSVYRVHVLGHRKPVDVEVPPRFRFAAPASTVTAARRELAEHLAPTIRDAVHDVTVRDIVRDDAGRAVSLAGGRTIPRSVIPGCVGWHAARAHVDGAVDEATSTSVRTRTAAKPLK